MKTSLAQEGLTVVTYSQPKELTRCKKFLENPDDGALITTPQLFSGMEAANVIWVRDPNKKKLDRSSTLRAIHKLCIIDPEPNLKVPQGLVYCVVLVQILQLQANRSLQLLCRCVPSIL